MTDRADLIARLRAAANDPMWPHHAEVPAKWLNEAADALSAPAVTEALRRAMDDAPPETDVLLWFDKRPPLVAALFDGGWVTYDGGLGRPVHDEPVAWTPLSAPSPAR